jgi:hypothetical protein
MKTLILVVTVLTAQFAMAQKPACQQEAQIIAKVAGRSTDSLTHCSIKIDPASIVQYNVNQLCPLDLSEVLEQGIEVGLTNGHDCDTPAPGSDISGVLVKTLSGAIILE